MKRKAGPQNARLFRFYHPLFFRKGGGPHGYPIEQIREYSMEQRVDTYDVGPDSKLRFSALCRYCQEASERHLESGWTWATHA